MRLLDLFCGAGGAAMGYHRAGFNEIVGVDNRPQHHYPFEFVQGDALEYCTAHGHEYDMIHASPPCQGYSVTRSLSNKTHPMLIDATRAVLIATGRSYVIENVPGAPLINPLMLCGTMFGLGVIRHRLFECEPPIWFPPATCVHNGLATGNRGSLRGSKTPSLRHGFTYVTVAGNNYLADEGRAAMGIEWMTRTELSQAIPPAYTEWIGRQLLDSALSGAPSGALFGVQSRTNARQ
jgi:DNA (cytosine-5)-methyltransferase 1